MTTVEGGTHPSHPRPSTPRPPTQPSTPSKPRLGEVVRDAERTLQQAINILGRQWDPASGPQPEPWGPEIVDIRFGSAVADIRSALREIAAVTTLGLPPVGSAVPFPARRTTTSTSLPGGPPSHPVLRRGEGPAAGPADAAVTPEAHRSSRGVPPCPSAGQSYGFTLGQVTGAVELAASFTLPPSKRWAW